MRHLSRDLVLHRIAELRIDVDSTNEVSIALDGRMSRFGRHTLAVLDAFVRPTTFADALERLRPRAQGPQDWMDLASTIVALYEHGVLRDGTGETPAFGERGFASMGIHVRLLNDRQRTSRYLAAIREVVRPGDVVVDIGTGTGVLAAAAAQAGARRVYAIEASGVSTVAQAVFAANDLADRVHVIRGWSTEMELPEKADVLVSELIGNEPLNERVVEITADAIKRLLKPDARFVPDTIRVYGLPVTVPRARRLKDAIAPATVRKWRSWYGIDFRPVLAAARPPVRRIFVRPWQARTWPAVSAPVLLAEIVSARHESLLIDNVVPAEATRAGSLTGILIYFELDLAPGTTLSTSPAGAARDSSWHSVVWVLDEPLRVRPGDTFGVRFQHGTGEPGVSLVRA